MSGQSKTRTMFVSSAGSSSSDKKQATRRQRGIPTRVHGNNNGMLDVNRNMQSSSLTNFAHSNVSSTSNGILQNSNFEHESAQSGKIAMLKRGLCISIPVNSVKTLRRMNSPNCSLKCDNQSQLACILASSIENNMNRSAKKVRPSTSAVDASEFRSTDKKRIESCSLANHCASYDIPSKLGHSKLLLLNKNKNLNKILSSDEISLKKCKDSNSHVKSSVSAKEISHETVTMIPQSVHGIRLAKESFTGKPSVISNSVKKPSLKPSCSDILSSSMTSHPKAFEKSNRRSETKMPKSEMQANFSHQGSGPLTVSHQKTNKQSLLKNDSRKQSASRKSSESVSIESSVGLNERRKFSENSGHRASELSEKGESFLHVSNEQRTRYAARHRNLPSGVQGKYSRTAECRDIGINSNLSSERGDLLGQELILKTLVQWSRDSRASSVPESREAVIMSDVSFHADKPVARRTSVASENDDESHQVQESLHDEGKLVDDNIDLSGRVFHARHHRCAANSGGQLNTRSRDSVVDDSDSVCLDFDNRQDKETRSLESGDVVLDAETFQQMIDELKTLKMTILHLQRMLLQICTGENSIHNNDIIDTDGSIRVQERHELRKRVNELEKLVWEQRKIIDGLKQTSVELETVSNSPEIGAATSEAETELAFRTNCCTTDDVNEPLCVGCSSDATSSVDIASSVHENFQFVNGGIQKQNMRTGHHFTSSPLILPDNKHNILCNYQYPTNDKSILGISSRDALNSSCNSIDIRPEIKPYYEHKKNSSQCTFSTESEKHFVRQRTCSEDESTVDCSMFDFDGTVDSDHERDLGEPSERKHSRQMGNNDDLVAHVLDRVIGQQGSEVACNHQRLGEHLGNMTDFHSGLSDGSYVKFSLDQQEKIGLDFSMSENSIASKSKLIAEAEDKVDSAESFQTREKCNACEDLSSERKTCMSQSFPTGNDVGENSVAGSCAETDCSVSTQPDKVLSNSRSLIRMPKSYSTAAECKVKRSDNSVSDLTPTREVCNSLPNTVNTAQPKSASLPKTTKKSREICTYKLPASNASKLPASIAK